MISSIFSKSIPLAMLHRNWTSKTLEMFWWQTSASATISHASNRRSWIITREKKRSDGWDLKLWAQELQRFEAFRCWKRDMLRFGEKGEADNSVSFRCSLIFWEIRLTRCENGKNERFCGRETIYIVAGKRKFTNRRLFSFLSLRISPWCFSNCTKSHLF